MTKIGLGDQNRKNRNSELISFWNQIYEYHNIKPISIIIQSDNWICMKMFFSVSQWFFLVWFGSQKDLLQPKVFLLNVKMETTIIFYKTINF